MKTILLKIALFCLLGAYCSTLKATTPIVDSVISWKKQATKMNTDLNTFLTAKSYASVMTVPLIKDSITSWKRQARLMNTDLNTYLTALLMSVSGSPSYPVGYTAALTGTGTVNRIPVYNASNSFTNSTISTYTNGITSFSTSFSGADTGNDNYNFITSNGGMRFGYYNQPLYGTSFDFYSGGVRNSQIEEYSGFLVNKVKNRWSVKNYNSNTSNLWVDMSTGFVGVGSDYFSPSYQFQVNGKGYFHDNLIIGNNSQLRFLDGSNVDKSRMYFHNPSNNFYHYSEGGYRNYTGYGGGVYFETSYANYEAFVNRADYKIRTQNSGGEDFYFTIFSSRKTINCVLPTSSAGLVSGDWYTSGGVINVVP